MKNNIFDLIFITVAAVFILIINHYNLAEQYLTFSLIPLMGAYYVGKYVGIKFEQSKEKDTHSIRMNKVEEENGN
jgi:hypothetical protein